MKTISKEIISSIMKNIKNLWTKTLLIVFLGASIAPGVKSQELVSDIIGNNSDSAIVRVIDSGKWMVYGIKYPYSEFYLYSVGSSVVQSLKMEDEMHVSDFEKFGDNIYFCGYYYVNGTKTGMAGYFNLSSFPSCPVFYYRFSHHSELKKIDLYSVASSGYELHMAMVGETTAGEGSVVDAVVTSGTSMSYQSYDEEYEVFDEIATTDNYVVTASRVPGSSGDYINIRRFGRPTSLGCTIFSVSHSRKQITYPTADGPVALCSMAVDSVAMMYDWGSHAVVSTHYTTPFSSPQYMVYLNKHRSLQIKFLKKMNKLEGLFEISPSGLPVYCEALYMPMTQPPLSIGGITGHRFWDNLMLSMDLCNNSPSGIVSAGRLNSTSYPRLFRFSGGVWESCSEKISPSASPIAFTGNSYDEYLPIAHFYNAPGFEMPRVENKDEKEIYCGRE